MQRPPRPTETTTGEETTSTEPSTTTGASEPAGTPLPARPSSRRRGAAAVTRSPAAGSSGNVGPNLDEAKPDLALVVDRVTNGMDAMPSFKDQLDEQQIQDVAAYVVASTQG